jgi:hypothetical protein
MINNLPSKITLSQISKFNFGNIEANDDKLLFESVCKTAAIDEFLNGEKNIVLGEKGTGKTALFRLLKEKKMQFVKRNGHQNLILSIDDNFQYKHIKNEVLKLVSSSISEESFKYQIVWEIFLYHKIINFLSNQIDINKDLKKSLELCNQIFGKSTNGISEIFKNYKRTFGIKLYNTPSDILLPDFYTTSEPINPITKKENSIEKLELDLDYYKAEVSKLLKSNNKKLIILIDRLDEFVSRSENSTQIEMLEALIAVEREYSKYPNIELNIFLRDDLFNSLSFEGIGYDKVVSKRVELKWSNEKIREFIARRILFNFVNVLGLNSINITVDHNDLEIDTSEEIKSYKSPNIGQRLYRSILKRVNPNHYAQKFARKVNLSDDINKQIILTIFPRYIEHVNNDGKTTDMDIFDYFSTHFNLGTGNSIPRLFILYLNKCFEIIKDYYRANQDQIPNLDSKTNCYEIVKRGFFSKGYKEFQKEVYNNFAKLNKEFEPLINLFKDKRGNRITFRAKELKGLLNINDGELELFCDYMIHIGMFTLTNNSSSLDNQKFEIPILFRL